MTRKGRIQYPYNVMLMVCLAIGNVWMMMRAAQRLDLTRTANIVVWFGLDTLACPDEEAAEKEARVPVADSPDPYYLINS